MAVIITVTETLVAVTSSIWAIFALATTPKIVPFMAPTVVLSAFPKVLVGVVHGHVTTELTISALVTIVRFWIYVIRNSAFWEVIGDPTHGGSGKAETLGSS